MHEGLTIHTLWQPYPTTRSKTILLHLTNNFFSPFIHPDLSKESGRKTEIELLTSAAEVAEKEENEERSRPPVQSEHALCHAEQREVSDSIPHDATRKEITFAMQSCDQIPELTKVDVGMESKADPDEEKGRSKFYENLAFAGTQVIDSAAHDSDDPYNADKRQEERKLSQEGKEAGSLVLTKGGTDTAIKGHIMAESSSISDEELVELAEVEKKFVTRESFCRDGDDESGTESPIRKKLQAAIEVRDSDVDWEEIQETTGRQGIKAVVLKRVSDESPDEDSSLSVGKATIVAHDIVDRVIEEAKVKSLHSTPEHVTKKNRSLDESSILLSEDAKALAQEIVQNVIDEVKRRLSFHESPDHTTLLSLLVKEEGKDKDGAVSISHTEITPSPSSDRQSEVRMRVSRSSVDRDKESGSEAHYQSCETSDAKSPIYSRPTSSEIDVHLFPGPASSQAGGSSEYETCATSQGSTTTFASALASQDTSYATARSSLCSQQSSRGSTLEPDSEPESSGHPGDLSSEASETIIPGDDRDSATPTIHELEGDEDGSHDSLTITDVREPYDLPIPEEVIRGGGHEGPFMGHLISGAQNPLRTAKARHELAFQEDEQASVSEGTWHSSSVRTAVPISKQDSQRKSDSECSDTTPGQSSVVQQTLVSPLSIEESIGSIDLTTGGGSQLSQSSVRYGSLNVCR